MTIQDFFNERTLQHMQETFSTVIGAPVCVCGPQGRPLFPNGLNALAQRPPRLTTPIRVDEVLIGQLALMGTPAPQQWIPEPSTGDVSDEQLQWVADFLKLMAAMLSSLCNRQKALRLRVEELSTLYRLTAEFTGQRDLQSVLDRVSKTVVQLLGGRACTIRLLSEDGQTLRIKSANNIEDKNIIKVDIPLEDSEIDREAIRTRHMVYVPDLGNDPRVLFPQGARAEGLISCLAAPLVYKGRPVGVIRLHSDKPYRWDRYEQALFYAIAAQAAAGIVNADLQDQAVTAANIKRQLRLAGDVQQRMFPHEKPTVPGMDISAIYVPCFELGGDFFDFIPLADGTLGLAVCDVVGKGIRASLLMASIRAALRAHATNIYEMSEIIQRVNTDLCAMTETADFATLFYGVIDSTERTFTYVNAGHPPGMLFRQGEVVSLSSNGGMLGVNPDWQWGHDRVHLQAGDLLILHTDGLTEALNFQDEAFGSERVQQAVRDSLAAGHTPKELTQQIRTRLRNFAGLQTRVDDLTIVAITVQ